MAFPGSSRRRWRRSLSARSAPSDDFDGEEIGLEVAFFSDRGNIGGDVGGHRFSDAAACVADQEVGGFGAAVMTGAWQISAAGNEPMHQAAIDQVVERAINANWRWPLSRLGRQPLDQVIGAERRPSRH